MAKIYRDSGCPLKRGSGTLDPSEDCVRHKRPWLFSQTGERVPQGRGGERSTNEEESRRLGTLGQRKAGVPELAMDKQGRGFLGGVELPAVWSRKDGGVQGLFQLSVTIDFRD